jgi:hypothetical protein
MSTSRHIILFLITFLGAYIQHRADQHVKKIREDNVHVAGVALIGENNNRPFFNQAIDLDVYALREGDNAQSESVSSCTNAPPCMRSHSLMARIGIGKTFFRIPEGAVLQSHAYPNNPIAISHCSDTLQVILPMHRMKREGRPILHPYQKMAAKSSL